MPPFGAFTGTSYAELTFGGGGARSDLWAQIVADACNVVVHQLDEPANMNGRGAALLALVQLGRVALADVPSMQRVRATYEPQHHAVYEPLLEKLAAAHAGVPR